jgi:phage recombination protein Bet
MQQLAIYESKNEISIADSKYELIKNLYGKGLSPDEFELFLHMCRRTGLDPMAKHIYAIKRGNQLTIQVSIDGYRLIAERTGRYSPGREPTYTYDDKGRIVSSTAFVKKLSMDGTWHEVASTSFFNEYCVTDASGKPAKFWQKMPHQMIAKCAESSALRKAFPEDLSGTYTDEEMEQAENPTNLQQFNVDTKVDQTPILENKIKEIVVEDRNALMTENQKLELIALMSELPQLNQDKIWTHLNEKELFAWEDFKIKDFYHYRDLIAQRLAICKRSK